MKIKIKNINTHTKINKQKKTNNKNMKSIKTIKKKIPT